MKIKFYSQRYNIWHVDAQVVNNLFMHLEIHSNTLKLSACKTSICVGVDIKFPKSNFLIKLHTLRHRKFWKQLLIFAHETLSIYMRSQNKHQETISTQTLPPSFLTPLSIQFRMHNVHERRRKMLHYVFPQRRKF